MLSQGAKQNGVYSNAVMDAKKGSKGNLYVRVENGEYQIRKLVQRKAWNTPIQSETKTQKGSIREGERVRASIWHAHGRMRSGNGGRRESKLIHCVE